MRSRILAGGMAIGLVLASAPLTADPDLPAVAVEQSETNDDVSRLAALIDGRIEARWEADNVTPAPPAGDAEFLRRVSLDIAGTIPPVAEVRAFLADDSPTKRRELVDRLLDGPRYVRNFTNVWRSVMMPEAAADVQVRFLLPSFEAWLRKQLIQDVSYADMVREILTTPLNQEPLRGPYAQPAEATPLAFYQAKQIKPENLAASTSRMFLGIRIECAQCHNHPFDSWKQEEFWSFAAFFAGIERQDRNLGYLGAVTELNNRTELQIPETDRVVQAAYLNGTRPDFDPQNGPRATLAEWMTSPENPYFARTAVNRMWAHFLGTGLVDPVDDFGAGNPSSHPKLLNELARAFARSDFDMKFLIRAITSSRAYQLTSRQTHSSQDHPQLFARMAVKGLTAEQLFDSVAQATGYYEPFQAQNRLVINDMSPRGEFLETFGNETESPTQQRSTILQALAMMNGSLTANATNPDAGATLAAVADFPLMNAAQRIETLYLATLTRKPRPEELSRLVPYVDSGGVRNNSRLALADVFWALLNSSEFILNH